MLGEGQAQQKIKDKTEKEIERKKESTEMRLLMTLERQKIVESKRNFAYKVQKPQLHNIANEMFQYYIIVDASLR